MIKIVDLVGEHFPHLMILVRAWDVVHAFELREKGCADIERESFESALRLSEHALRRLGCGAWRAKQAANRFRADDELMEDLYRHFHEDLEVRASISASARQRLQEEMEADEAYYGSDRDAGWR